DKENEDPKLAFYERLSSKKNEVRMRAEPPREIPMKEKPAEAHRREAANKPPAPAQPRTSAGDHLQYTVQLASMGEKVRADAVIKDLRDRGYEAYMTEAVVGGKVYYRVRCGRFMTQEEAGKHARKLAREAGLKGLVSRIE
ncbi:MAG: SPOR domain-containing protein, partial [Deltaproteobacteria bacterium]